MGLPAEGKATVFGFPGNPPRRLNGAWSTCEPRGAVGGGLVQLDVGSESALRAQPGYSGAPVIVRDSWGDAVVGMLAVTSRDGSTGDAYAVPMSEVAAAWPEVLDPSLLPDCPYRGLHSFTAEDARTGVFVGREREVTRLRSMVKTQPLVVVTGPSGVGKSSLVAAGLEPALAADGWVVASFRPGATAYDAVARALLDVERPAGQHSLEQLASRARAVREEGFWAVASKVALLTGRRLALIGDQFEEVLSSGWDRKELLEFLGRMFPSQGQAQSSDVRLICTLRADFLPDLLELPDIGQRLQDRQLNVPPLDESALTRVIVEPAALAGVTFTEGLAGAIAREASRGPGGLPLLEFTLTELWPMQRDRRISFDSYYALGGVSGALNRHAGKVYSFLTAHVDEARIRRVLLSMIRARGGSASAVRVTARRSHLGEDWHVAQLMSEPEQRLVVLGPDGSDTAEIAHEALIRGWNKLAAWVDEDADFQQWLAMMEERAAEGDLLSALRVAEAQRWLDERRADVPYAVVELVEHSSSVILHQQKTEKMLGESQRLAQELMEQSSELMKRQRQLEESNTELASKAQQLADINRDIKIKNVEIEDARQVLQERSEQLAVSMEYRTQFLANLSHELRNPLNSLLILAKLLADNLEGNLSAKQVQFAETIHGAGSDLLQLINDILDLVHIEGHRIQINPTRFELSHFADHIEAIFRPLTLSEGLDFHVSISPELPATMYTDEARLLQILRNLLSNAVKFTDAGSISLLIQPAERSAFREAPQKENPSRPDRQHLISFAVRDTGIGIAPDKMNVIFESFRQLDGAKSRKYGGTGLGLSICREIAHLLGGEILACSQLGEGSTFTLYLPIDSKEPP
ncbi:nSTAND1 domain-containing NTPase [Streptomyces sp. 4N509B]|uniref:nSTAND1 domain-containing NTPase n=1 Tax=Streptomyces sp. 4N509B TaxID=3457413 RepID=UPI003FD27D18